MTSSNISLEGAPNFRDLGGYDTNDGRKVRSNVLFRSGHLAQLTDRDLDLLDRVGVRTIVDFRPDHEVEMFGTDRLNDNVTLVSIPIGDHAHHQDFYERIQAGDFTHLHDLADASREMITNNAPDFAALLRLLADDSNLPLIFHCIGGKDRTGVAAALILSVLGVPWKTVQEDYLESNERNRGVAEEQVARLSGGKFPVGKRTEENLAALRRFFNVEPSYIDAARDEIERVAGSFDAYVTDWLGLSPQQVAAIRSNLLD